MRERIFSGTYLLLGFCVVVHFGAFANESRAQKKDPDQNVKSRIVYFAVLDDGKSIEPIGLVDDGKFVESPGSVSSGSKDGWSSFFVKNRSYSVIFGGSPNGTAKVVQRNAGECSGVSAQIRTEMRTATLRGHVMAIATNAVPKSKTLGVRRLPTLVERNNVESLVRAEYSTQGVTVASGDPLRYQNLTAIDVDKDGTIEMVGSFWADLGTGGRALLFFIASKGEDGNYSFQFKEFEKVTADDIMSGEVKDLDEGVGHELLLDYFDIDGDGTAEVFTTSQAFEGRHFAVYRRVDGRWGKINESYNYRCGY